MVLVSQNVFFTIVCFCNSVCVNPVNYELLVRSNVLGPYAGKYMKIMLIIVCTVAYVQCWVRGPNVDGRHIREVGDI